MLILWGLVRGNELEEITGKVSKSEKGPGCLNFDIALEMRAPTAPFIKLMSDLVFWNNLNRPLIFYHAIV